MAKTSDRILQVLQRRGPVRSSELERRGLSRMAISRLVAAGKIHRVARGLYAATDYRPSEYATLVTVGRRMPNAVFCLLTALRLHDLTTQAPFEVWIAVGNKARTPRMDYPPLRVVRFSGPALRQGIEIRSIEGVKLHVTSVARTIADCFKFRNKIGLDVALEALREARKERRATNDELWRYAKLCRVATIMRPYLEAVS